MVRTFIFHIGLTILLFTFLAGALRMWRALFAAIPILLFTLGPTVWQFRPRAAAPAPPRETLRVMSVNVLAFNRQTAAIIDEIHAEDPDLLLVQELTPAWRDSLHPAVVERLPYFCVDPQTDCFGLAIYSRRPFERPVESEIPLGVAGNPQMRAVIKLAGRDVVVYNVHLLPPSSLDYFTEQRRGFADLYDLLHRDSYTEGRAVLVGGDFNFTNDSPMAGAMREVFFRDTHDLAGYGRGATWPNKGPLRWLPGVRIDHIYLSSGLVPVESRVGRGQGSDHRPVLATIGFRQ